MSGEKILLTIMAFILPPLPVFLQQKTIFTKEFLVCLILTFMGHLPGTLFALYYIYFVQDFRENYTRIDEESETNGVAGGRISGSDSPHVENSAPVQRYTDEETETPQPESSVEVLPVEGSSDAPPPTYDESVPKDQQLKQSEIDSKSSGDNKVQR